MWEPGSPCAVLIIARSWVLASVLATSQWADRRSTGSSQTPRMRSLVAGADRTWSSWTQPVGASSAGEVREFVFVRGKHDAVFCRPRLSDLVGSSSLVALTGRVRPPGRSSHPRMWSSRCHLVARVAFRPGREGRRETRYHCSSINRNLIAHPESQISQQNR